jgi:manganese transport protein
MTPNPSQAFEYESSPVGSGSANAAYAPSQSSENVNPNLHSPSDIKEPDPEDINAYDLISSPSNSGVVTAVNASAEEKSQNIPLLTGFRSNANSTHSLSEVYKSITVPFKEKISHQELELQPMQHPPSLNPSSSVSNLDPAQDESQQSSGPNAVPSAMDISKPGCLPIGGSCDPRHVWRIRSMLSWFGVGLIISVGYMDPGNWQTDLSGGASFYYSMLFVILVSNLAAVLLQHLSLKLGVASERDLAQACRDAYSPRVCQFLWITTEIAIIATDLAEVTGSAVALQLLFGIPLPWGCLITAADVIFILIFEQRNFRYIEGLVGILVFFIFGCFIYEISAAKPNWGDVMFGFLPSTGLVTNSAELFNAIGIIGATVMPHNLYLHSSIVQTRAYPRTIDGKKWAIKYAGIDSVMSLTLAFFINAAILILAAAAFYTTGQTGVAQLQDAYTLLSPTLGATAASTVFALALLASGQQATITGTLAGQIVMEGFVNIKIKPWQRRLLTRLIAIIPAIVVTAILGSSAVANLLIISQVILSFQLTFSIVPLVHFTSMEKFVGPEFVNARWLMILSVITVIVITVLNIVLIVDFGIDPGLD